MLNLRCELWSPGGRADSSKGLRLDTQEGGGVPTGNVHGGRFGGLANGLQDSVSHSWGRGVTWCMLLVLPCTAAQVGHCKREPPHRNAPLASQAYLLGPFSKSGK